MQCVKRYTCDYSDEYTCKECNPCAGHPIKCNLIGKFPDNQVPTCYQAVSAQ